MKYFGTDGFRGRANEELTAEHAFRIGRFWAAPHRAGGGGCSSAKIRAARPTCSNTRSLRASCRRVPMPIFCM